MTGKRICSTHVRIGFQEHAEAWSAMSASRAEHRVPTNQLHAEFLSHQEFVRVAGNAPGPHNSPVLIKCGCGSSSGPHECGDEYRVVGGSGEVALADGLSFVEVGVDLSESRTPGRPETHEHRHRDRDHREN